MSGHRRKEVSRRIGRIRGHVQGIIEMLDEGRSYAEIVHQISAVRSSLDSVIQVIVDDMVEDCVARAKKNEPLTDSLLELRQVVAAIR